MGGEAYEDIIGGTMEDSPVYKIDKKMMMPEEKIKIEYIKGIMKGTTYRLRREIAEDLIRNKFARRVE